MTLSDDLFNDCPESEGPQGKPTWAKNKVNTRTIRSSSDYKQFWARFREKCATHRNPDGSVGAPCHLCSEPIEYYRRYPDPWSFSLDHLIPVSEDPSLLLAESNARASHKCCNELRGADELVPELGDVGDDW